MVSLFSIGFLIFGGLTLMKSEYWQLSVPTTNSSAASVAHGGRNARQLGWVDIISGAAACSHAFVGFHAICAEAEEVRAFVVCLYCTPAVGDEHCSSRFLVSLNGF